LTNNSERGCNFRWPASGPPGCYFRAGSLIWRSDGCARRAECACSRARARAEFCLGIRVGGARARNSRRVFSFRRATSTTELFREKGRCTDAVHATRTEAIRLAPAIRNRSTSIVSRAINMLASCAIQADAAPELRDDATAGEHFAR